MTQQTPPNNPENPGHDPYGQDEPSFAQNRGEERNPYYRDQRQAASDPDLDAASPVLTTTEAQRLNRKALIFLFGILALALLLGYLAFRGAGEDEDVPEPVQDSEMAVPDLPTPPPIDDTVAPPVELAETAPPEELPLPPPEPHYDPGYGSGSMPVESGPRGPSLMERRMMAAGTGAPAGTADGSGAAGGAYSAGEAREAQRQQALQAAMMGLQPGGAPAPTVAAANTSAQFMSNPNALLVRGTYLRCVLETRIITDVEGFTSCILTEPVYSVNGRSMLLPKGSKILGQYGTQADGVARVAVVWDRVITPTGIDVSMRSPGVDGLGGAGHPGDYNGHWGSKITSALLISLISDGFQWAANEYGPKTTTTYANPFGGPTVVEQPFESATARSMERLANEALRKSANRPGTVTINQGSVVNVYVAQDVDFSGVLSIR